ncbi:TetR/AcrR family transcriptional regulator [Brevibacterium linens]|uniref:TetR/AcrR family transcriptional regulator n=1 Tax=Brevibacterium linens TaxID=1703 RepID=UPI003BF4AB36
MRSDHSKAAVGTRERILRASSRLFFEVGFEGAGTRAIADAVGIRQPSLFYHFSNKEEIGAELVDRRISQSPLLQGKFAFAPDDPALDLFNLFRDEAAFELSDTVDTRWLFRPSQTVLNRFPEWKSAMLNGNRTVESIVIRGIDVGVFRGDHSDIVLRLLDAVANDAMFWPHEQQSFSPNALAAVLLRFVVVEPAGIEAVVARSSAEEGVCP